IAILAAILFPVFAKAREKARQSSCLSNCKQIGLAFMQYAQDYDETLSPQSTVNNYYGWTDIIFPYVKSQQVYDCPSYSSKMAINPATGVFWRRAGGSSTNDAASGQPLPARTGHSYGVNSFYVPGGPTMACGPFNPNARALASIDSPASVVLVADGLGASPWDLSGGNGPYDPPSVDGQVDFARHSGVRSGWQARLTSGAAMCIFADGHAKYMTFGATMAPKNLWTCIDTD
ncbi:MAG TPA: hypothetical protein DCZ72_03125, partial [Armatimonadetes bacterium]|nr:hypothetical protein [Armatimonadota bacterium]